MANTGESLNHSINANVFGSTSEYIVSSVGKHHITSVMVHFTVSHLAVSHYLTLTLTPNPNPIPKA